MLSWILRPSPLSSSASRRLAASNSMPTPGPRSPRLTLTAWAMKPERVMPRASAAASSRCTSRSPSEMFTRIGGSSTETSTGMARSPGGASMASSGVGAGQASPAPARASSPRVSAPRALTSSSPMSRPSASQPATSGNRAL